MKTAATVSLTIVATLGVAVNALAEARITGTAFPEVSVFNGADQKTGTIPGNQVVGRTVRQYNADRTRVLVDVPGGQGWLRLRDVQTDQAVSAGPASLCDNRTQLRGTISSTNGLSNCR